MSRPLRAESRPAGTAGASPGNPAPGTTFRRDTNRDERLVQAQCVFGSGFDDRDPPTSQSEILAAIAATKDELASGVLDADAAMELVACQAQFLTDARGAVFELLEGNELVYRAATGTAARSLGLRVDSRKSMSGLCFRSQQVMRCDDTEKDDRVDKAACRWVGIRSMVLVPVVRGGRSVGVLAVISPAVAAFGDRDVWTMQRLADLLPESLVRQPSA
jgi:putative methionine-R-sulfoxide reductase with GAF domain